jgi:hypothetical protein
MSFRKKKPAESSERHSSALSRPTIGTAGINPRRDEYLFWYTDEGYIIAQDIACQYEYVEQTSCPSCGGPLRVVAHLNRAGQGLSEMVTVCENCRYGVNFIFDISNSVYQTWWAEQLGALYIRQYDGPPREPHSPH